VPICLPDELSCLQSAEESGAEVGEERRPSRAGAAIRRLHPARDDRLPLYVQEHGARVGIKGHCLIVSRRDQPAQEARLANTSQVSLFGNVQLTTQAMRALLQRGVPVSFFTTGGWLVGRAVGMESKNVELRVAQYAAARDCDFCLSMARALVRSKVRNCRTLLRRNLRESDPEVLGGLRRSTRRAMQMSSLAELLGVEGTAARLYYGAFAGMLKAGSIGAQDFGFAGRNRRPPRDPINALLSFAYALLVKEFSFALTNVGLDPMLGYYHQPRFGRPALALDLMEEFRPIVADSVVITVINNGEVRNSDFLCTPTGTALKPGGRKRFILAYERRMDQLVTHRVFGYRISYRRVLEVQARLLSRLLMGELDSYPTFQTR
jgi:CRISPR-associated protein Cas1